MLNSEIINKDGKFSALVGISNARLMQKNSHGQHWKDKSQRNRLLPTHSSIFCSHRLFHVCLIMSKLTNHFALRKGFAVNAHHESTGESKNIDDLQASMHKWNNVILLCLP